MTKDPHLIAARRRFAAELRAYDSMVMPAKLRRTHEHEFAYETPTDEQFGPELGYLCGHKVSLCDPCDKCQRSEADCSVYRVALAAKLRALLARLK